MTNSYILSLYKTITSIVTTCNNNNIFYLPRVIYLDNV